MNSRDKNITKTLTSIASRLDYLSNIQVPTYAQFIPFLEHKEKISKYKTRLNKAKENKEKIKRNKIERTQLEKIQSIDDQITFYQNQLNQLPKEPFDTQNIKTKFEVLQEQAMKLNQTTIPLIQEFAAEIYELTAQGILSTINGFNRSNHKNLNEAIELCNLYDKNHFDSLKKILNNISKQQLYK